MKLWASHNLPAPSWCRIGDVTELSCTVVAWARQGLASSGPQDNEERAAALASDQGMYACSLHLWVWTTSPVEADPEVSRVVTVALLKSNGVYHRTTIHLVTPEGIRSVDGRGLKAALAKDRIKTGGRNTNAPTEGRILEALARCPVENRGWQDVEKDILERYASRTRAVRVLRADAVAASSGFFGLAGSEAGPALACLSLRVNRPCQDEGEGQPVVAGRSSVGVVRCPAVGTTAGRVAYLRWAHNEGRLAPAGVNGLIAPVVPAPPCTGDQVPLPRCSKPHSPRGAG